MRKDPLPDKDELRRYYEKAWQFSEPRPKRCLDVAAQWISSAFPAPQPIFLSSIDVGGKDTSLLIRIAETPNVRMRNKAILDAQPKDGSPAVWLGDGYRSPNRYGFVTATHVLEHAIDPVAFIHDIDAMLGDDGYVYLEVPSLELGAYDVRTCDDLNPNHLTHFSVHSLTALLMRHTSWMLRKVEADMLVPGWPSVRVLAQKVSVNREAGMDIRALAWTIDDVYGQAIRVLGNATGDDIGLYGASHSYYTLRRMVPDLVAGFPVFDLYKHDGQAILHPDEMEKRGIRSVFVTPRFWNSAKEIGGYIRKHYPSIQILDLYHGLLGE